MTQVNNKQVGGSHYQGHTDYQHWDWAIDCCLGCLEYGASRYVIRDKVNPVEDWKKAAHFIEKIMQSVVEGRYHSTYVSMAHAAGGAAAHQRVEIASKKLWKAYFPEDPNNWRLTWCVLLAQWQTLDHLKALHEELQANIRVGSLTL